MKRKRFDKRLSFRLTQKDLQALIDTASQLQESKSAIVKRSIAYYVDYHRKHELPILNQRLQSADFYEDED